MEQFDNLSVALKTILSDHYSYENNGLKWHGNADGNLKGQEKMGFPHIRLPSNFLTDSQEFLGHC